jgi:hypothetical protein
MSSVEALTPNEKGAWAETFAQTWLIERGFWVSRNVAHPAPFDLVAVGKDGKTYLFDVKYIGRPGRRKNLATFRVRSSQQIALGVRLFCISAEHEITIEPSLNDTEEEATTSG